MLLRVFRMDFEFSESHCCCNSWWFDSMVTLKVCQFTFLNVPHVLRRDEAGTVFLIGQLICSLGESMAFYPPVPHLRCKPANPLCTREGGDVLALPRMSSGNELLPKWDSGFSVRPANITIAQFWFCRKRHGLKERHMTYFSTGSSARREWLLVSPLPCPLMPFIILVSYLMLKTAVKGFFYREAVLCENASFGADELGFPIRLSRCQFTRAGDSGFSQFRTLPICQMEIVEEETGKRRPWNQSPPLAQPGFTVSAQTLGRSEVWSCWAF